MFFVSFDLLKQNLELTFHMIPSSCCSRISIFVVESLHEETCFEVDGSEREDDAKFNKGHNSNIVYS